MKQLMEANSAAINMGRKNHRLHLPILGFRFVWMGCVMKSIAFATLVMVRLIDGFKTETRRVSEKPKFAVGDLVWVKEALFQDDDGGTNYLSNFETVPNPEYKDKPIGLIWPWRKTRKTLPSMCCPKWASRMTIKITEVKRQDIYTVSDEEAVAEGFQWYGDFIEYFESICPEFRKQNSEFQTPFYVWAYKFEVVQ